MKRSSLDTSLLIHPGYHKSGTTWLQTRLFRTDHGFAPLFDHDELHELVFRPGPFHFDSKKFYSSTKDSFDNFDDSLTPVISSEILSGLPYTGGRDCGLFADRLHESFPNARILITIREQMKLLPSMYMQYLQSGGTLSPRKFFEGKSTCNHSSFSAGYYEYDRLVAYYRSKFGPQNVLVLPMEQLVRNPIRYVKNISEFTGSETDPKNVDFSNISSGARENMIPIIRRINHFRAGDFSTQPLLDLGRAGQFLYRTANKASRLQVADQILGRYQPATKVVSGLFKGRFAESNRRLQKMMDVDLSGLGYQT